MSNDDSKSSKRDANFAAAPITEPFNKSIDLEAHIATLSPAGQQECRSIQRLSGERLEAEKVSQQKSHNYRVMKEQVSLLENYVRHPAPRPPGVVADPSNDLQTIRDTAERTVRDREAHFLDRIQKDSEANIRTVVARERKGHQSERGGHDHEQGR